MCKYKLISVDLDGTLLNSDKQVSEENRRAIREYTARGGLVVPNSGRSLHEMAEDVRSLCGVRYFICSDGADIYDKEADAHISLTMNRAQTAEVFKTVGEYETYLVVHYAGSAYIDADRADDAAMRQYGIDDGFRAQLMTTTEPHAAFESFCHSMEQTEMICVFFKRREELLECRARLTARGFVAASTAANNIEVFSAQAGKGNAICALAERLGIRKEEIIAAGDGENDASMFSAAGLKLAVENANDLLKAQADAVICKNDEHIMPYILEKYI